MDLESELSYESDSQSEAESEGSEASSVGSGMKTFLNVAPIHIPEEIVFEFPHSESPACKMAKYDLSSPTVSRATSEEVSADITDEDLIRMMDALEQPQRPKSGSATKATSNTATFTLRSIAVHPSKENAANYLASDSPYRSPQKQSNRRASNKYEYIPVDRQPLATIEELGTLSSGHLWVDVREEAHCIELLGKLKDCAFVSFELIYKQVPVASSSKKHLVLDRWAPFIAQSSNDSAGSSSVVKGIAFSFGGNKAYYIPLPCPLPQKLPDYSRQLSNDSHTAVVPPSISLSLDSIGDAAKELICRYVGFQSILFKCRFLVKHLSNVSLCEDEILLNPLLEVSKSWVTAARSAISTEWQKSSCVEWKLVDDIMTNPRITKLSTNLIAQLVALRERDITPCGPFQDPIIGSLLLPESCDKCTELFVPIALDNSSKSPYLVEIRNACLKTLLAREAMESVKTSLMKFNLFHVFESLEMPLLISAAEMQFVGMPADWAFFSDLHRSLVQWQQQIDKIFKVSGHKLSPASHVDVKALKHSLTQQLRVYIATAGRAKQTIESTKTDWSAGTQLSAAEEDAFVARHPLLLLVSEWRSLSSAITSLSSIIKSKKRVSEVLGNRVRAKFNTIGTETGRMIVTSPPLQQCPKTCSFKAPISCDDVSIHQLLLNLVSENRCTWKDAIVSLNGRLQSTERVKARRRIVSSDGPQHSLGTLKKITCLTISASSPPLGTPLADYWEQAGVAYSAADRSQIVQVLVELGYESKASVFHYPADQVFVDHSVWDDSTLKSISAASVWKSVVEEGLDATSNAIVRNPRSGFRASHGFVLLSADYSQIELRIMAHFSKDANLLAAIAESEDVFRSIASQWLKKSASDISSDERNSIKQICYAFLYGAGPKLVADNLKCTYEHAKGLISKFMLSFPGLKVFIESTKRKCREQGFVETILGRRRYIPGIASKNSDERSRAERQAVNTLCQGSAADLIKKAMILLHDCLAAMSKQGTLRFGRQRSSPGGALYSHFDDDARLVLQVLLYA